MDKACLFCQIASGQTPADIVYQGEEVVAFKDIHPQAPIHILIVPKKHIPSLNEAKPEDIAILGKLALAAAEVARRQGLEERGYRLALNCGAEGGQVIPHLHFHLLGGRRLGRLG